MGLGVSRSPASRLLTLQPGPASRCAGRRQSPTGENRLRRALEVSGTDATPDGKFFPVLHLPASQQFKERGQEFEVGVVHLIQVCLLFKYRPSRL